MGRRETLRRRLAAALDATGMLGLAYRARSRYLALRSGNEASPTADGVPLPPPQIRVRVGAGNEDAEGFLYMGRRSAEIVRGWLADEGVELDSLERILDFGCGCGRVARFWAELEGPQIEGCDVDPRLIAWCQGHLPFMRAVTNELEPPAPYEDNSFDLIYAFSVFTHLPENLQHTWLRDLERMLRPGGWLLLTTHGERLLDRLSPRERERFGAGELVVQRAGAAGTNACTAFHPRGWVRDRLLADWELVRFEEPQYFQDSYLARKPPQHRP